MVVRRYSGEKMAAIEGRFKVPAARFSAHLGDSGRRWTNQDQGNRRQNSAHRRVSPVRMGIVDLTNETQETGDADRKQLVGILDRKPIGNRHHQSAKRRKSLRITEHFLASMRVVKSSASQATAATNSTQTPMKVVVLKNKSIGRLVEYPAANTKA